MSSLSAVVHIPPTMCIDFCYCTSYNPHPRCTNPRSPPHPPHLDFRPRRWISSLPAGTSPPAPHAHIVSPQRHTRDTHANRIRISETLTQATACNSLGGGGGLGGPSVAHVVLMYCTVPVPTSSRLTTYQIWNLLHRLRMTYVPLLQCMACAGLSRSRCNSSRV
ncbi:hypothetical protein FKP32DRAFT_595688 [Trametes sanguinea]|nr:hypothetical protein FKP32DRAFT_595688 [Trametes sanguinea]